MASNKNPQKISVAKFHPVHATEANAVFKQPPKQYI
jgi:hypothetical protein